MSKADFESMEVDFLTVYVDNILITFRILVEHMCHIRYVLERLQSGGLTENWDKSKFV